MTSGGSTSTTVASRLPAPRAGTAVDGGVALDSSGDDAAHAGLQRGDDRLADGDVVQLEPAAAGEAGARGVTSMAPASSGRPRAWASRGARSRPSGDAGQHDDVVVDAAGERGDQRAGAKAPSSTRRRRRRSRELAAAGAEPARIARPPHSATASAPPAGSTPSRTGITASIEAQGRRGRSRQRAPASRSSFRLERLAALVADDLDDDRDRQGAAEGEQEGQRVVVLERRAEDGAEARPRRSPR